LLAATALNALGLAWIYVALPSLRYSLDRLEPPVWIFVVGGTFVGAGVLQPLELAPVGAMFGALSNYS
jgi:hypothetical protein